MFSVLGLVVARGGSKGLPRKNVRPLAGHPLVAYAVRAGLASTRISDVIISTDDPEISAAAVRYGAQAPFPRPAELAGDRSPVLDTIIYTVEQMERQGQHFDAVCLLQPTTPLRTVEDIDEPIAMLESNPEADSVVALTEVVDAHPARLRAIEDGCVVQWLDEGGDLETQQRQAHTGRRAYRRCGSSYVTRVATLKAKRSLYGEKVLPYVVPGWRAVSIDDETDFLLVETLLTREPHAHQLRHLTRWLER